MRKVVLILLLFFSKAIFAQTTQIDDSLGACSQTIAIIDEIIQKIDSSRSINQIFCFDTTHDPGQKIFFFNKFIIHNDSGTIKKITLESQSGSPVTIKLYSDFYFDNGKLIKAVERISSDVKRKQTERWFHNDKQIFATGDIDDDEDLLSIGYAYLRDFKFICRKSKVLN